MAAQPGSRAKSGSPRGRYDKRVGVFELEQEDTTEDQHEHDHLLHQNGANSRGSSASPGPCGLSFATAGCRRRTPVSSHAGSVRIARCLSQ